MSEKLMPPEVMDRLCEMSEAERRDFLISSECLRLIVEDGQRRAAKAFEDYCATLSPTPSHQEMKP